MKIANNKKRMIYKLVYNKEFDDKNRGLNPLPLDIAFKTALHKIESLINSGNRLYATYENGIYKGQILNIKSTNILLNNIQYGDLKNMNITNVSETFKKMIKKG